MTTKTDYAATAAQLAAFAVASFVEGFNVSLTYDIVERGRHPEDGEMRHGCAWQVIITCQDGTRYVHDYVRVATSRAPERMVRLAETIENALGAWQHTQLHDPYTAETGVEVARFPLDPKHWNEGLPAYGSEAHARQFERDGGDFSRFDADEWADHRAASRW